MARYTGPRQRMQRALGVTLSGLTRKNLDRRPHPPGQHGPTRALRRGRVSEYGVRLCEKQKLRYYYGLREAQLVRYVRRAARRAGRADLNLLRTLELRLDNAVFRLGLAPTIPAARQLVSHRHLVVNGRRVSIPSYLLRPGDVVGVHESAREHPAIVAAVGHGPELALPSYLARSDDGLGGRVVGAPERTDVPLEVNEAMVIEYYSRV